VTRAPEPQLQFTELKPRFAVWKNSPPWRGVRHSLYDFPSERGEVIQSMPDGVVARAVVLHTAVANGTAEKYRNTAEMFAEWDKEDAR
jgi:hypothetical protein